MNVSRPARCLFSGPSIPSLRPRIRCQNFHSSPNVCSRQRPKHASLSAAEMGLTGTNQKPASKMFPAYTKDEKEHLKKLYTPGQIAAIEAGEAAIDPEDLKKGGVIRTDLGALDYLDDFSTTRPILDRIQPYEGPVDPNPRIMNLEEAMDELERTSARVKEDHTPPEPVQDISDPEYQTEQFPNRAEMMRIMDEASFLKGSDGKAIPSYKNTVLTAPRLPKEFLEEDEFIKDESDEARRKRKEKKEKQKLKEKEAEEFDPRDPDGSYNRLIKQTGLTLDDILDLKIKTLVMHRVVNQTRLGKISSQYCLAIAGDGQGRLGIGEAKGQEGEDTIANARISAIRAMQPIPRYENRTIYGDVEGKMSAVVVKLMARPPGFGLRCQHLIFEMARAAGIQDLSARVPRSRNKMNTVKAAYNALMKQRIPDEVARARGKKLVDVRKVYYGGRV